MLVQGALFEQPIPLWFAVNEAGSCWQLLEKYAKQNANTDYSSAEWKMLEKIRKLRGRA